MLPSFKNNKWRLKLNRSVPQIPASRAISLGLQFSSQYLIIEVSTTNQLNTWQVAGKIWANSFIYAAPTKFFEHNLELLDRELIFIPETSQGQYELKYRPPRHFTNVKIKIWEYMEKIEVKTDFLEENISFLLEQIKHVEELIKSLDKEPNNCLPPKLSLEQKTLILRIQGRL